ncbi:MAG: NAD(P)-binding protein [Lachnospiraceae bacterium]|nr:NAD(P)-binding protein [Lachnospiraceae bacterium]
MIRINQIKLPPICGDEETELKRKAARLLRLNADGFLSFSIVRKSFDARKKPEIYAVYTVDVSVADEQAVFRKIRGKNGQIQLVGEQTYCFPASGKPVLDAGSTAGKAASGEQTSRKTSTFDRPVVVGTGPAGLFCGYMLAKAGYRPLLLERGREVHKRREDVERFWREGVLDPGSNVQFGEGGAGTFSDGKLTTTVKDQKGRMREVLRIFVKAGAPKEILYEAKPHIGTDILICVVENLRRQIVEWGGEVRFESQVTSLLTENGRVAGVTVNGEEIRSGAVVLAIGHSARDTFQMLHRLQIPMEAKAFAVGLRMEHPQEMIDRLQYGDCGLSLPAAPYKVTAKTVSGRGVYSFCMCPGGYVVNASSEPGRTAVNGMSYSGRDGANSNSAMIVTVSPADYEPYGGTGPLAGIAFQRHLEERAYSIGRGAVPVERYGDFREAVCAGGSEESGIPQMSGHRDGVSRDMQAAGGGHRLCSQYPGFVPAIKGTWQFAPVHDILPEFLNRALAEGIDLIGQKMPGFADRDAYLSGVESRTSSPVRILRDESGQSALRGLYPCGEGAGYAGGITSAAMDGILIAEKVASAYGNVIR